MLEKGVDYDINIKAIKSLIIILLESDDRCGLTLSFLDTAEDAVSIL
jgi:hypothetical protein